jgi:GntR family transcriptional regulator
VEQIRRLVALGALKPGDQLPTAKQMAIELTINPNTVNKAYRELERDGLIDSLPGKGTFVRDRASKASARALLEGSRLDALGAAVREAKAIGLPRRELTEAFAGLVNRYYGDPDAQATKGARA